jgi:hypothetical protein
VRLAFTFLPLVRAHASEQAPATHPSTHPGKSKARRHTLGKTVPSVHSYMVPFTYVSRMVIDPSLFDPRPAWGMSTRKYSPFRQMHVFR